MSKLSLDTPKIVRFAFLSDMHLVKPTSGNQRRLIDWCRRQIKDQAAGRVVLGGDLTHHADPDQSTEVLDQLALKDIPIDYLPGNNEGERMAFDAARHRHVRAITGCRPGGEGWPGHVFLLQTTHAEDAAESLEQLARQWPDQGNVLVLAHFPPDLTPGMESVAADHPNQRIFWICGHKHARQETIRDNLHLHISSGLDPVKARGSLPDLLMVDWDGEKLEVQTLCPPESLLHPAQFQPHPIGLAYLDTADGIVQTALEHGIQVMQFRCSHCHGKPSQDDLDAVRRFRERFPDGFLSLHMPNFADGPQGPVSSEMSEALQWAEATRLDDLTIHLPGVPAGRVFDERHDWLETPWTRACRQAYLDLAERAIEMGAQLSLENLYNKQAVPPMEEKLSSRPWHLIRFVEWLRQALADKGHAPEQVRRVGIIFDAGHAFRDACVSKIHGLADWIQRVGPYLQLSHIHQVGVSPEGKKTNHRPITDRLGPFINYAGVLGAVEEQARRPVPLLIEVRDKDEALQSWRTLTGRSL